jgi:sensor histidine kinase YesM
LDIQLPAETKPFFEEQEYSETSGENSRLYISSLWKTVILYFGSFLLSLITYYRKRTSEVEEQQALLMQDKVKMELNFLRSQINPHFLFNALNNIYSMIYTGDQHAADSVLSLSEMLRYVTYESKESRILLSGEISYLENYIEFQKFSYEGEINVVFEKDILSDTILIAPMLFQPFVENAFKYSGIGQDKDAYIRISLSSDNYKLMFSIENSKKKISYSDKELKTNGIGIENVKKRLDLMYPNRHSLIIDDKGVSFRMNMSIELDNDKKNNVLYGK